MVGKEANLLAGFYNTLEAQDRQLLLMHYADRLSVPEMAVVLDITEASIARTMSSLRQAASLYLHRQTAA